jgi:hypothetical protein
MRNTQEELDNKVRLQTGLPTLESWEKY